MVGWHHWCNGHELKQTLRQWRTGKPTILPSMGSQRVRHDSVTQQEWRRRQSSLSLSLSLSLLKYKHWGKPYEARARSWLPINQEHGPHQELDLPAPCSWTSQALEIGETNVHHLSHRPIYGILFQQPELTKTANKFA